MVTIRAASDNGSPTIPGQETKPEARWQRKTLPVNGRGKSSTSKWTGEVQAVPVFRLTWVRYCLFYMHVWLLLYAIVWLGYKVFPFAPSFPAIFAWHYEVVTVSRKRFWKARSESCWWHHLQVGILFPDACWRIAVNWFAGFSVCPCSETRRFLSRVPGAQCHLCPK